MRKLQVIGLLAFAALVVGCGPSGNIVTGKASTSDGTPLPRGVVSLSGNGSSYTAAINAGSFELKEIPDGTYNVTVTGAFDKEPSGSDGEGFYKEEEAAEPESMIDAKYSDPTKSGLSITVPSASYELTLDPAGQ